MLIKAFEEQVARHPGKIAVKSGTNAITYRYLDDESTKLSAVIQNHTQPPLTAALLFGHNEQMIIALFAALKASCVYIPFDPIYPEDRLLYMLTDSGTRLIITGNEYISLAERLKEKLAFPIFIINIDTPITTDAQILPSESSPTEVSAKKTAPAYILYTSGSTGKPKGVVQTWENINYYIDNWCRRFSITTNDRMALFASYCHDGAVPDIFSSLLNGATLYPYDIKGITDISRPALWLKREAITIWHSVPTWYRYFINTLDDNDTFPQLRLIILGGEQVRENDIIMFKKYFSHSVFGNIYGQTESTVNSIWLYRATDQFNKIIIGEPIDKTEILVVDENGNEVDELETGEIVIAGHYLSNGYLNKPLTTHAAFSSDGELDRLYWTGDLGRLLPDETIEILGRKDFQVKVRGFRIEPGEIETALLSHPAIAEAVVIAKSTETGNTYSAISGDWLLSVYIVFKNDVSVPQLRNYLGGKLPDYMVPTYFIKVDKMPLTGTNKIDRIALANMGTRMNAGTQYTPPKNKIEETLTSIWQEVLNLEKIGTHDNFFHLGGNSMDAIYMNKKLKEKTNISVPVAAIYQHLTINNYAAFLMDQENMAKNFLKRNDRSEQLKNRKQRLKQKFKRIGG